MLRAVYLPRLFKGRYVADPLLLRLLPLVLVLFFFCFCFLFFNLRRFRSSLPSYAFRNHQLAYRRRADLKSTRLQIRQCSFFFFFF